MGIKEVIDNYAKTHFDLSIGTGSAIAAIVEQERKGYIDREGKELSINRYSNNIDYLVINVETICRNIIEAIDGSVRYKAINMYQEYIYELALREITYIDNILQDKFTKGVYFFFPNYDRVYDAYYMQKKKPVPSKKELIRSTISNITYTLSRKASRLDINYISEDYKLGLNGDVLLLTHYGHDLLNLRSNKKLKLLESHTGVVIDSSKFNKKYRNNIKADVSRLPMNEVLMMILGSETITSPVRGALGMVLEVAEKYNWTPNTTIDKVRNDLSRVKELKDFTKFKGIY